MAWPEQPVVECLLIPPGVSGGDLMSGLSLHQEVCQDCGMVSHSEGVMAECGSAILTATDLKDPYPQVSIKDHSGLTAGLQRPEALSRGFALLWENMLGTGCTWQPQCGWCVAHTWLTFL